MTAAARRPAPTTARGRTRALVRAVFQPPSRLRLSEWAERDRYLSPESNPEPGPWRNDRAPYLVAVMDAVTDPRVHTVVCKCCSQSGKTEVVLNATGYYSTEEPAPILVIQPTLGQAQEWSTQRLAPMIRDSPRVRTAYAAPASRDAANTILSKTFTGGHITIVGANSAAGLAAKPIRIVAFDEVDRFPPSAGTEGDPVELGTTRTRRFWNRKRLATSSPTLKGESRIEEMYDEGDRQQLWLPCPHCGALQVLQWSQLVWRDGDPRTVEGVCTHCGVAARDYLWHRQLAGHEWIARGPRRGTASFAWNALVVPWVRWEDLTEQWLRAQGAIEKLQVFTNTVLAETWEEGGTVVKATALEDRAEVYPHAVPAEVAYLTCGVDVQHDRLEYVIRGWGLGEQSWLIEAGWLDGEPEHLEVWQALEGIRLRKWRHAGGKPLGLAVLTVDSGFWADEVYAYTGPRWSQRVYATKGLSTLGAPILPNRPLKRKKGVRVHIVNVGTEAAKTLIYARLKQTSPGPGTYHWPADPTRVPDHYWTTLTSERKIRMKRAGRWLSRFELPRGSRAEALDCEVLALVGWRLLRRSDQAIQHRLHDLGRPAPPPEDPPPEDPYEPMRPRQPPPTWLRVKRGRGWVRRF